MKNLTHAHGGDVSAIEREYGIPKNEIIDFSGNINPLGFPKKTGKLLAENISLVSTYPDKNYTALKEAISGYTGLPSRYILVGNGSTELISAFMRAFSPEKTVILGPAYSEYEFLASLHSGSFRYFELKEKDNFYLDTEGLIVTLKTGADLLIICNPNNPTGSAVSSKEMSKILKFCENENIYVMVDETYMEFCSDIKNYSSLPLTENFSNLFVIRGISKFFASPGLRLGYGAAGDIKFREKIEKHIDPWSVNILASFAGENLFNETEYIKETFNLIKAEREKALLELETWKNIKVYPSSSNFILFKLLKDSITSFEVFEKLILKKMLIRDAESFRFLDKSYLRFCLMLPEENQKLLAALKEIIED